MWSYELVIPPSQKRANDFDLQKLEIYGRLIQSFFNIDLLLLKLGDFGQQNLRKWPRIQLGDLLIDKSWYKSRFEVNVKFFSATSVQHHVNNGWFIDCETKHKMIHDLE